LGGSEGGSNFGSPFLTENCSKFIDFSINLECFFDALFFVEKSSKIVIFSGRAKRAKSGVFFSPKFRRFFRRNFDGIMFGIFVSIVVDLYLAFIQFWGRCTKFYK
jgi:hypothetical protein